MIGTAIICGKQLPNSLVFCHNTAALILTMSCLQVGLSCVLGIASLHRFHLINCNLVFEYDYLWHIFVSYVLLKKDLIQI